MPKGDTPLETIQNAMQKTSAILARYNCISVSLSGGSDSDVMLDLILRVIDDRSKLKFVFFNTGIEWKATLDHLDYLEQRYDIHIERVRAYKPVPLACKEYGHPFLTKHVSEMLGRAQNVGFDFQKDGYLSFDEIVEKYSGLKSFAHFWANVSYKGDDTKQSMFTIDRFPFLKEFIIENPPTFKISDKCCYGAKKHTSEVWMNAIGAEISCIGLRKSEGGVRAASNTCFDEKCGRFKPIFWLDDETKRIYEEKYNIVHSDCYTKYGMKRTGCAGCPFNSRFKEDILIAEEYEPKLAKGVKNIFAPSFEYTQAYRAYKAKRMKNCEGQIEIDLEENDVADKHF